MLWHTLYLKTDRSGSTPTTPLSISRSVPVLSQSPLVQRPDGVAAVPPLDSGHGSRSQHPPPRDQITEVNNIRTGHKRRNSPGHRWVGRLAVLLASQLLLVAHSGAPGRAAPNDAEEQANCEQVTRDVTENSAPVLEALERLAQQRHGRSFSELTPEQMMQLSLTARVAGKPMTLAQQRMEERCTAYQRRKGAMASAAAGFPSLFTAAYYLDRWGRESVAGLGCSCPGFPLAGDDVDQSCPSLPSCPGQLGGHRIPEPARGCRTIGAAAWIRQQLPEYYRILGVPPESEEVRDGGAALNRQKIPSACPLLPAPAAPALSLASLGGSAAPASAAGPTSAAAIGAAAACFATPTAPLCQQALVRGDALVLAAKRAGRERCLGYALTARTLWALGADPGFTDLLIRCPEATRLRNEARIALRYLRADCRGL